MSKTSKKTAKDKKGLAANPLHSSRPNLRRGPLSRIARTLLGELNTGVARAVRDLLDGRKFIGIAELPMPDINGSGSPTQKAKDYLAYNLLRKSVALETGIDTRKVALQKWRAAEDACSITNSFGGCRPDLVDPELRGLCERVFHTAQRKIQIVLGDFSWDEAIRLSGFSGGASTRLSRANSHPANKYLGPIGPTVTRDAAGLAMCALWHSPQWRKHSEETFGPDPFDWFHITDFAHLDTVPKDAKTDRVIAIEPELNMYFQRGIGKMIRSRLRKVSINLNDQTINQEMARLGSLDNSLATVDLSSASDMISRELVEDLLPKDWFAALDLIRSKQVLLSEDNEKTFISLEKFSSMGNGYTFELESLIFWALTASCVELEQLLGNLKDTRLSVFGDDIICHRHAADLLYLTLEYSGFSVNKTKSFVSGPFRESCGKHYYRGYDVSPFFVKEQGDALQDLYWFANSVRLWCGATGIALPQTYHLAVKEITKLRRTPHLVPIEFGLKAGLISNFDEACPPLSTKPADEREWLCGYLVKVYSPRFRKRKLAEYGRFLFTLNSMQGNIEIDEPLEHLKSAAPVLEVEDTGSPRWSTRTREVTTWGLAPSIVSLVGNRVP